MRLKPLITGFRILLFLIGTLLLFIITPHLNPYRMKYVSRVLSIPPEISISVFGSSLNLSVSETQFLFFAGIALLVSFFTAFSLRQLDLRNHIVSLMLTLELFAFTLIPYSLDIFHDSKSVVSYLVLGLVSFAFILSGATSFVGSVVRRFRLSEVIDSLWEFLRQRFMTFPLPWFLGILVVVNFLFTNLCSFFLFNHIPHIEDSIAQLFHAKIFALGRLTAPAPPHPEFFQFMHVINVGQWYSQYPPGHSFLLMLGLFADAAWIVNPLFGSLTIIPLYALGKELYGEVTGRISAILALCSPFLVFMSSEFMNHTTAMFFFVVFLLFYVKSLRTGRWVHGLLAGIGLGWFMIIRPYSAFALSLPFLLYGLIVMRTRFREMKQPVLAFSCSLLIFLGIQLVFNALTNGHPLVFGFDVLWGENVRPGFGHSGWGPPHNPLRGLFQTLSNLNGVNKYLFEWPVPSLLFIALLFMSRTRNTWDYLSLAAFGSIVVAYFFYWFQDWCFGPRFFFESSCLLILLTARGMEVLPDFFHSIRFTRLDPSRIHLITFLVVVSLFAAGFTANIPPLTRIYGNHYWNVGPRSRNMVSEADLKHAVVFSRARYGEVFPENSPLLDGEVIFVKDRGSMNSVIMKTFKGYQFYLLTPAELLPLKPD